MRAVLRTAAGLGLALAATGALGAEWTAEMVEDEGGSRMMASVVGSGGGDVLPELFMFCGADQVNLRYAFGSGTGEDAELPAGKPLAFTFEFGNGSATLDMQFEEMDGAYAAYFPKDDKILGLFRSAATVIVDDPTGVYQVQAFPLTGSSDAIDTLLARCD